MERRGFDAPKLVIDASVDDFYRFTVDSFQLAG